MKAPSISTGKKQTIKAFPAYSTNPYAVTGIVEVTRRTKPETYEVVDKSTGEFMTLQKAY